MGLGQHVDLLDAGPYLGFERREDPPHDPSGLAGGLDLLRTLDGAHVVEEIRGVLPVDAGLRGLHVLEVGHRGDVSQPDHAHRRIGKPQIAQDIADLGPGVGRHAVVIEPAAHHGVSEAPQGIDDEHGLTLQREHHESSSGPLEDVAHVLDATPYELIAAAAYDQCLYPVSRHLLP